MPTTSLHTRAVRLVSALLLLVGCTPAPTHTGPGATTKPTALPGGGGTVVVGATGNPTPVVTAGGTVTPTTPTASLPPPIVSTPVVSNNGGSVIHGSVLVPPAILSNNGSNIVSPNGGTIVSPNGGTIVSPNGGTIVSPNGGTIVSPNGGTIVSPNGGTIVSNNGGGFKLMQVPMRFAEVKLTDAAGAAVKDASGVDLVTKTDENGNYSFPVDVKGRNLVVRALVPGQSESLLGLVSKAGAEETSTVDLNSTLSLSYIIQNYVEGDLSRFEKLESSDLKNAIQQTDAVLAQGSVLLPKDLSAKELTKKVDEIRLRVPSADTIFQDIRRRLVPLGDLNEGDGLKGLEANFGNLDGAYLGGDGTIYFMSQSRHSIWKLDSSGIVHTLVPRGKWGYPENQYTASTLALAGIALLPDGNVVVADSFNHRIVRINPQGEVITIAGTGRPGFDGDKGQAIDALINFPTGLCVDKDGSIYFSDSGNNRIRKISPEGRIDTVVGDGGDDEAIDLNISGGARLKNAQGISLSTNGDILVADSGHHRILELSPSNGVVRALNDPSKLSRPVCVNVFGNDLLVLDADGTDPHIIKMGVDFNTKWDTSYEVIYGLPFSTSSSMIFGANSNGFIAGGIQNIFYMDKDFRFYRKFGVNIQDAGNLIDKGYGLAINSKGVIYVSDGNGNRLFAKQPLGTLLPVAGKIGTSAVPNVEERAIDYDDANSAPLPGLAGIAVDPKTDELLMAVRLGSRSIRRLTSSGRLEVSHRDLRANVFTGGTLQANVGVRPQEVAISRLGEVFVSGSTETTGTTVIGRLNPDGTIDQIDGANTLRNCASLCTDNDGKLYFLEPVSQTVYRADGVTLVSVWDVDKYFSAEFVKYNPTSIVVDRDGVFYVSEGFHVYRFNSRTKQKALVAGPGAPYFSGTDRDSSLDFVTRMVLTDPGDLYLLDRTQVKLITASQLARVQ